MRSTFTALILAATIGFAAPSQAQAIAPNGVMFGQSWNLPQDFQNLELTQRARMASGLAQGSGTAAERATRAARQAQFNRSFPGTPIRRVAAQ